MGAIQDQVPYEVLGIHVLGDNPDDPSAPRVVRARMFVDGKAIDEDLELPRVITVEEQIEEAAKQRIAEIKKNVKSKDSKLTVGDGDVVVNTKYTRTDRGYDE